MIIFVVKVTEVCGTSAHARARACSKANELYCKFDHTIWLPTGKLIRLLVSSRSRQSPWDVPRISDYYCPLMATHVM